MKKLKRYQYEQYAILCHLAYPDDFDHTQYGFLPEGREEIIDRWGRPIIRILWGESNEVVLVFKGSQNIWDWLLNLACFPKKVITANKPYYVHWGYHYLINQKSIHRNYAFHQYHPDLSDSQKADIFQATQLPHYRQHAANSNIIKQIQHIVAPLIASGKHISLTGHSSGGAMAVLSANYLNQHFPQAIKRVVTFGQPATGFWSFKKHYPLNHQTYRICCDLDIVTFLPAIPFMHWHVGQMLWLHNGKIYQNIPTIIRLSRSIISWIMRPFSYHFMQKYIRNKDFFDKH
ncbi:lipase family protein [Photobacterium leiognathi]|uniref:lipase family protein n=1 Tax=Photobacterium leiognathi TaxID=553611 RepID=UPI0027382717|nr:lipase [Photobacterium leiognathi]